MSETTPSPLGNVITIDDERIKDHLDRVVRGSVEETLNALLDAEGDRLCNAQRGLPTVCCGSKQAVCANRRIEPRAMVAKRSDFL
jgi:hypothetical protein